jgi:hypothetical protein
LQDPAGSSRRLFFCPRAKTAHPAGAYIGLSIVPLLSSRVLIALDPGVHRGSRGVARADDYTGRATTALPPHFFAGTARVIRGEP